MALRVHGDRVEAQAKCLKDLLWLSACEIRVEILFALVDVPSTALELAQPIERGLKHVIEQLTVLRDTGLVRMENLIQNR